jgi:CubicO group peptidase (beta-lactamase class C family)
MRGGIHYDIEADPIMEARNTEGATTRDIVDAMAKVPLNFEPGSHYQYTLCHDVLAAVVEAASGMRFSHYLQANIFDPLGIKDMGFRPNEEQKSRFYQEWNYVNGTNRCTPRTSPHRYQLAPLYESGGAGLFATVGDYMKILTALANGGTTEGGYSLLRPETVKLLTVNHLDDTALNDFAETRLFGYGWGLCGRVHRDPVVSLSLSPVGEFGWDGAAGAFNMVDTQNRVALYFGTSIFRFTYGYNFLHPTLRNLVYQALEA